LEPWARISGALWAEQKNPGEGLRRLSKLWHDSSIILPSFAALLIRNLIVLTIQRNNFTQAEGLVQLAMDRYPRCAELAFLAGWMCIQRNNLRAASRYARQALESADRSFIGSGGECSYRSKWLLGLAFELEGKQAFAIQCFSAGVHSQPAFLPSVLGLIRQRVSYLQARGLFYSTFSGLVQREPQYLEPVFHFLLLHRQLEPARRLLIFSTSPEELRERLQKALDEAAAVYRPKPRAARVNAGIMLIGPFYVHSSIARINRELGAALASTADLQVAFEPHGVGDAFGPCLPRFGSISEGFKNRLSRLDLTIRHHWPPDFDAPPRGKLVSMLHWEYGSVPKRWVEDIERSVTELWVSSRFTKEVFGRGGVHPDRIRVLPPGIDTEVFKPEGAAWRPEGCRSFAFLFVGGAIFRKGADVLWNAYVKAFSSADDVTLIVKDIGASSFYRGQSLATSLRAASRQPRAPHLIVLSEEIDDAKLAALYRGSNILVLPYRGEGFGLPLAESLACGRPVITTGEGPAREFCPPEASTFIPAKITEFPNPQSQLGPMTGPLTAFEPDVDALAHAMRSVFDHPEEISRGGAAASEKVRSALNWERITGLVIERIRVLTVRD
ncbi:MAG: glycosyltransferase, partial [Terriglobia bacterium]